MDMFCNAYSETKNLKDSTSQEALKKTISSHLTKLHTRFCNYFPDKQPKGKEWIQDPFGVVLENMNLPKEEESQLVKLSCIRNL